MRCEHIKELLLTDYLDDQLDVRVQAQVKEHLRACAACRRFEEEVRAAAVEPFKEAADPKVPDAIWQGIREKINERQQSRAGFIEVLLDKLKALAAPRPAMAFATCALVVLVATGAYFKYSADKDLVKEYFAQQIGFYAAVDSGDENSAQLVF